MAELAALRAFKPGLMPRLQARIAGETYSLRGCNGSSGPLVKMLGVRASDYLAMRLSRRSILTGQGRCANVPGGRFCFAVPAVAVMPSP